MTSPAHAHFTYRINNQAAAYHLTAEGTGAAWAALIEAEAAAQPTAEFRAGWLKDIDVEVIEPPHRSPDLDYSESGNEAGPYFRYRPRGGRLIVDGIEYLATNAYCESAMISLRAPGGGRSSAHIRANLPPVADHILDHWCRTGDWIEPNAVLCR